MKAKKFATQIDEKVFLALKDFVDESGVSISKVVTKAIAEYLQKNRVRPMFKSAMDEVLNENEETLKKLAE